VTPPRTGRAARAGFAIAALGFLGAAIAHALALAIPGLLPPSPAWRHAIFVVVNAATAWGLVARPRWFPLAFAALALQQIVSHGSFAWETWRRDRTLDPSSAIVLVAVPLVLGALVRDARVSR
jgi:MFS family permease